MEFFRVLEQEPALFYTSIVIFSLLVGSFLNVVIHRMPIMLHNNWKRECLDFLSEKFPQALANTATPAETTEKYNLIAPRSACPHCGHMITAMENIPVISYLFLKGRCRACKAKISLRYPIIETMSAVMAVTVAWKFGYGYETLFALLLTWSLLCLTFIDLDHQYLPDQITLPFLWLGLLVNLNGGLYTDSQSSLLGAVAGYLTLWIVFQLFKLITKKEGMGFGDFKLLGMLGAWLGWQMLPAVILLSSVIGSVVGISLVVLKLHDRGKPIPFGPYLAGAGWITLLWGKELNELYFNLVFATG